MADEPATPSTPAAPATPATPASTPAAPAAAPSEPAKPAAAAPAEPTKPSEPAKPAEPAKAEEPAAPIDYAKTLKLPEGMKADAVFEGAAKLFGEHKLSSETAQALIDFTADRDKQIVKAVNDGNTEAWTKMRGEWKADTEKNVSAEDRGFAKEAAIKVFDKKTAELIESYGLTDHRGFVEALVKVSKAIKDDTFVQGNAAANGAGSDARKMFPNSNMNP